MSIAIPRGFSPHYILVSLREVPMSGKEIIDKAIARLTIIYGSADSRITHPTVSTGMPDTLQKHMNRRIPENKRFSSTRRIFKNNILDLLL